MQQQKLIDFLESRSVEGRPLVMATVFETRGSTYSKPGARMLIDANGVYRGMLSGGCLEGDLAIRARQVIESGQPQVASYDLASDDDELWGLGVGCDGVMRVFLQPLSHATAYEPFATISELQNGTRRAVVATVIASASDAVAAGASVLHGAATALSFGVTEEIASKLHQRSQSRLETGGSELEQLWFDGADIDVFFSTIVPVPRLLVLGGGPDAEPLLRMAAELGWRSTVTDHRPAYIDSNDLADAELALCCSADEVHSKIELDSFDLAIVMSHHLVSDRNYLRQLAFSEIGYIGLLGPRGRRQRLLLDIGQAADRLRGRLHGPAGLDLGGHGPAAIALSIVAEMQQHLVAAEISYSSRPAGNNE